MPEISATTTVSFNKIFQGTMNSGQSLIQRFTAISTGNFPAGSEGERIQNILNATVPTGKTATIVVQISGNIS